MGTGSRRVCSRFVSLRALATEPHEKLHPLQVRQFSPRHLVVDVEDVALGAVFAELLEFVAFEAALG